MADESQSTQASSATQLFVHGPVLLHIARVLGQLVDATQRDDADPAVLDEKAAHFIRTHGALLLAYLSMNGPRTLAAKHMNAGMVIDHSALLRDVVIAYAGWIVGAYREADLEGLIGAFAADMREMVPVMVEKRDAMIPRV